MRVWESIAESVDRSIDLVRPHLPALISRQIRQPWWREESWEAVIVLALQTILALAVGLLAAWLGGKSLPWRRRRGQAEVGEIRPAGDPRE